MIRDKLQPEKHAASAIQPGAFAQSRSLSLASDEAVVLMGHGSRDSAGADEFLTFAKRLSARLARPIYPGFLELADPPIVSAIGEAVKAGASRIVAVPWFLLGAGHLKNDLPTALQWAKKRYPHIVIQYGSPINVQPEILAILGDRLAEIDPDHGIGSDQTAVLLVQRGSSDPESNADVYRVARFLWEGRKYSTVDVAFSGITRPSIAEGLQRCLKYKPQHILVVPYYLYTGILVERISTIVAEVAVTHPECEFRVASHFGQDTRLDILAQRMISQIRNGTATMTCDMCHYRVPLFGQEFLVRTPQVSDHAHGLRGTTMSEEREADHAHGHHHAHQDGHIRTSKHHHSHGSDVKDRWDALRECVTAAGITNREEITAALIHWQSTSRAQLDAPPPYLLTALPGHTPTAALRWDWDSQRAREFVQWCMETLQERFGISWRVEYEEGVSQPGSQYLLMILGEQQERCDWRYLNQNHWMGAFCTIANRLLRPAGITALSLETGWFDTVIAFCRNDHAEEILRWFPEAE
jgi:sirohydrochlorin cobaltochelatase